jgi:hypothetical protein
MKTFSEAIISGSWKGYTGELQQLIKETAAKYKSEEPGAE